MRTRMGNIKTSQGWPRPAGWQRSGKLKKYKPELMDSPHHLCKVVQRNSKDPNPHNCRTNNWMEQNQEASQDVPNWQVGAQAAHMPREQHLRNKNETRTLTALVSSTMSSTNKKIGMQFVKNSRIKASPLIIMVNYLN